jgi:hypothetical protein
MKKIRDESSGVIIHIYVELSQGNSLYHKLKCHDFHFVFSLFSPTKSENRRVEQVLPGGELKPRGGGGDGEKE